MEKLRSSLTAAALTLAACTSHEESKVDTLEFANVPALCQRILDEGAKQELMNCFTAGTNNLMVDLQTYTVANSGNLKVNCGYNYTLFEHDRTELSGNDRNFCDVETIQKYKGNEGFVAKGFALTNAYVSEKDATGELSIEYMDSDPNSEGFTNWNTLGLVDSVNLKSRGISFDQSRESTDFPTYQAKYVEAVNTLLNAVDLKVE